MRQQNRTSEVWKAYISNYSAVSTIYRSTKHNTARVSCVVICSALPFSHGGSAFSIARCCDCSVQFEEEFTSRKGVISLSSAGFFLRNQEGHQSLISRS